MSLVVYLLSILILISIWYLWRHELEKQPLYLLPVILIILLIVLMNRDKKLMLEHMTSEEAIQNVASIYNTDKMIVKNLDVTGKITLGDYNINVADGNLTFAHKDGKVVKIASSGDIFSSYLGNWMFWDRHFQNINMGGWNMAEDPRGYLQYWKGERGSSDALNQSSVFILPNSDIWLNAANPQGKQTGLLSQAVKTVNGITSLVAGWILDMTDGHMRFKQNGDQKFVLHNNQPAWFRDRPTMP